MKAALTRPTSIAIRGRLLDRATPTPTAATTSATCSLPPQGDATEEADEPPRSRDAAHPMPAMPKIVTVCVQSALAATAQTGVVRPRTREVSSAVGSPSQRRIVRKNSSTVAAVRNAAVIAWGAMEKSSAEVPPPRSA